MSKIKTAFLWVFTPFQKFAQWFGRHEPLMTRESVDLAMSLVRPGDILLSYERQRITSLFIKGKYKHAAIFTSKWKVVEAVGDKFVVVNGVEENIGGVREVDLEEWLFLMDGVAIVRPIYDSQLVNECAGFNALSYLDCGYDYLFRTGNKSEIYCSELPYLCYLPLDKFFLKDYFTSEILPQVYRDVCDDVKFKLIYEFC